ncbi:type II toxin-antitoxin system HicB family antitoxin [Argonema galeatum]|uniref:type II toxin-antitoxin system HicB family antitoxin n=1 Tax=Argonema galeatum TaxID=2942762 RepID=UPI00201334EF|nr:type II toxin-antitoxin system HicB family antitoxin [Argonema galeatum]MCL1463064.1 type II toxin-antitoxin system HicB family antitoxin [Argonema galeatum A003/A1]
MSRNFTAIVYWEEDVYVAQCPKVGTASQGEMIEEAIANLKEATELYLEEFPEYRAEIVLWDAVVGDGIGEDC